MDTFPQVAATYASGRAEHDNHMEEQSDIGDETTNMDISMLADEDETTELHDEGKEYLVAEEPTDYTLYSNPPDLGLVRQRLFDIDDRIDMSPEDLETYFPFVDNVWRKCRSGEPQKEKNVSTEWYWCRLRKSANSKPHVSRPTPEGKQTRKKRVREERTCPMALKVIATDGLIRSCSVVRAVGPEVRHSHNLDYMDSIKRNSGIMDIARKEAIRGFLPGSVFAKMREEQVKMNEAGGKFMKVSDVRNGQYAWRQENPSVLLKAHSGYIQARSGPRQKLPSPLHGQPQPKPQSQPQSQPQSHLQQVQHIKPPQSPIDLYRLPVGTLQYPEQARGFLEPYMPNHAGAPTKARPHVTLTWASSLDSRVAILPGVQTAISGPETKAMTHYLRSRHDAIVIGVRTAISDDPGLNCRLAGAGGYGGIGWSQQPRPIIIDPHARLHIRPDMKLLKIVTEGRAKGPWVIVAPGATLHPVAVATLKAHGGEYLMINDYLPQGGGLNWEGILNVLFREGIKSVMIEGGGLVLSEMLRARHTHLVDSVILTIAPTFFGKAGVLVSPDPTFDDQNKPIATRLQNVRWQPMGDADVVMCGHMKYEASSDGILPGIEEFSKVAGHDGANDTDGPALNHGSGSNDNDTV